MTDGDKEMNVAVVGAGASGLVAAIVAARKGASVTIYERNDRPGKKILATGNGRCNLSNLTIDEIVAGTNDSLKISEYYHGSNPNFALDVIRRFGAKDTIAFFEGIGVKIKKRGNLLYPYTDQASSVLNALVEEAKSLGITIHYNRKVTGIEKNGSCFKLLVGNEENGELLIYEADRIIISSGSRCMPAFGSDTLGFKIIKKLGLKTVKQLPSLTMLENDDADRAELAGVRWRSGVYLYCDNTCVFSDLGEVQFVKKGVSGIVIFQASAKAVRFLENDTATKLEMKLDLVPDLSVQELGEELIDRLERSNRKLEGKEDFNVYRLAKSSLAGLLNDKLISSVVKKACALGEIDALSENSCDIYELASLLSKVIKEYSFNITGHGSFDACQTCIGGVDTSELDENMMVKNIPGIYITGELLDVDGICGGYNLQLCWATGHIAGNSASKAL